MAYKYKYYRKSIPHKFREQLGISEYKLSLKDISSKHQNVIKSLFDVEFDNVFNRVNEFDAVKLKEYMKLVYHKTLLDLYNIQSNLVDKYFNVKKDELPIFTLQEGIDFFKAYHTDKKKTSVTTLNNHGIYSRKLISFFDVNRDINTINDDELEEFSSSELNHLGEGSYNNHLAYFNGMATYLASKKKIKCNIFEYLDIKDVEDSEKEEFKISELEEIVNAAPNTDIKIATLIQAYTGMRIGEVGLLKKKNIVAMDTVNIDYLKDTKTKKHNREIPIHPKLALALKSYLMNKQDEDDLFSITSKALGEKVNKHIQSVVNDDKKSSHSFRRNFRLNMQLEFPELETYTNVLTAHTNKGIGFRLYGRNQAKWETLVKMVNSLDYKIKI